MIGPAPHTPLLIKAIKMMECDKAASTYLMVAEILKASGDEMPQQIFDLITDIIHSGKISTEWEVSTTVYLYNGKGVTIDRGNYQGLKLLDHGTRF